MPVVAIPLDELNHHLGTQLSKDELEGYLEQLGCDIEDFTQLRRVLCGNCRSLQELTLAEELPTQCPECLTENTGELWEESDTVDVVRMDLLPVRPDIFDPGGLSRAIHGLLSQKTGMADYPLQPASWTLEVDASVQQKESYRPFIACAVVRGLSLDEVSLRQIMKLQENLHWALGRDRKLASIGVYELNSLQSPIRYTTIEPEGLTFLPLQPQSDEGQTPLTVLETHPKGVRYRHLLADHERYPMLIDDKKQVLSMPPIINSHETRITTASQDVFIDVTGLVERTVHKTLHTLVTSLLELHPNAVGEQVKVVWPDGTEVLTPTMETELFQVDVPAASKLLGIPLDRDKAMGLLQQMRHDVELAQDNDTHVTVTVPAYRNDIMHEVDLFEDLAIAFNYLNIVPTLVPTMTVAQERPERILANRVRASLTGLGCFEVMSLLLSNHEEQYELLGIEDPGDAVLLAHPASVEQTLLRTMILPKLLKLFAVNRGQGLPQRLFEVDDIVRLVPGEEEPIEEMHVVAGILDSEVGFADVKALCESMSREIGMPFTYKVLSHPTFIPGRAAELFFHGESVGMMGEVHPAVLERLRLATPLVALEINLAPLLR